MIVPVQLPPGAHRSGSEYHSRGRWRDVNWVRWREDLLLPMGGMYRPTSSAITSANFVEVRNVRAAMSWSDNSGNDWVVFGSHDTCAVWDTGTVFTDITPTLTATSGAQDDVDGTWQFRSFGEIPLACHRKTGTLWEWDLNTANNLTQITNSPTSCRGIHVTPERFVWALGDGGNPRSIRWSDRDDRTVWAAAATNQAGGFDLETDGEIEFAMNLRGSTIVVTTNDVWRATYVGYPDVYAFERLGPCSVVGANCGSVANGVLYWMGRNAFYMCDGSTVVTIPCSVEDYVFDRLESPDLSTTVDYAFKVYAWYNHDWGEVWWHYPGGTNNFECSSFVVLNVTDGWWTYGESSITCVAPDVEGLPGRPNLGFLEDVSASDLVTNGTFAADSDWTKGTNWQITGGVANQSAPATSSILQSISVTRGVPMMVTFTTANRTTGTLTVDVGNGSGVAVTGNDTYHAFCADLGGGDVSFLASSSWDGDLDDVSVVLSPYALIDEPLIVSRAAGYESAPYAETGPLELVPGERRVMVDRVYPDEQDQGELQYTFKHREYPTATETSETAVTAANPTSVRFSGRQFKMRVEAASVNADWRCGTTRLNVKPLGKR